MKQTVEVPAIDFAAWLTKNVKLEDYVVVKMDIEHAEYAVLPRMLATGAACLVDELYLECHSKRPLHAHSECAATRRRVRSAQTCASPCPPCFP